MKICCYAAGALALFSATVMAECNAPERPAVPDGATSTMEEMVAGQKAVKAFQQDNVAYMKCLENIFTNAEAEIKAGIDDEAAAAEARNTYTEAVEAYNQAVSSEEAVAGEFNVQIREYKAANKN